MYRYILALICLPLIVACGNNNNATPRETADLNFKGDTVTITDKSPVLDRISVQKALLKDFSAEFRTVGTVRPVAGKLAEITPPFPGRIVKSHVKLGQKVNAGAPIFELSSPDFYEATKTFFAAQSANEVAQLNYVRQKELAANGVAAQRDLEQAQSDAVIAVRELEQAKANLKIFNVDADANDPNLQIGQTLKVVSPVAGEVIRCNVTIGSFAKEDSEPPVVVADLSNVRVLALVKEKYFGSIKQGDRVEVYTDAHPDDIIWGAIYYIGEMLDEETRSLEVIVECNNADRVLKLGMFCEVHFLSSPTKAIILPATAVMQEQDSDYVFTEIERGKYVRRKVVTESLHKGEVRIVSGIAEGENVVVEGGIFINI